MEITADLVLKEYAVLAFTDISAILDFSGPEWKLRPANEISAAARKVLAAIKVKRYRERASEGQEGREVEVVDVRLKDRFAALGKLFKHVRLVAPKHIQFEDVTPAEARRQLKEEIARLKAERSTSAVPNANGTNGHD